MAKINRHTGNLPPFGSNATLDDRKVYGGTTNSDELDENLTAEFVIGWQSTTSPTVYPKLRNYNAFAFTATKLVAYLVQSGIAEYDSQQTYYIGSICRNATGDVFVSLQDDNTGNALNDVAFWRDAVADGSITEDKLADDSVTLAKLAHITNSEYRTLGFHPNGTPQTMEAPLGVGQSITTVVKTKNTWYQNTTGRAIFVMVSVNDLFSSGAIIYLGPLNSEIIIANFEDNNGLGPQPFVQIVVPDLYRYKIQALDVSTTIGQWNEIR